MGTAWKIRSYLFNEDYDLKNLSFDTLNRLISRSEKARKKACYEKKF